MGLAVKFWMRAVRGAAELAQTLKEGVATVLGKGRKVRTVYLTEKRTQVLAAWLEVRGNVALDRVHALFVGVGPNGPGTAIGAATWSRAGGARLDAIAGMLDHSSVTTTGVYAKIGDKIAENPARHLEELMRLS